ncbi:MAG: type I 3-dehydroquinate dehydratase [Candidatus Bathyarchaeota archaeon]|nr:type I 3-dehydroquinate dehydratase [Candidatus Termiticorpusculum sp.]
MTANICVSIKPKNDNEALALIEKAEGAKADFIEVRLDVFESAKLSDLAASTKIPLIATNKLPSEGGSFMGTSVQCWQVLINAARKGFQYIDLNLTSLKLREQIVELKELNVKTLVSFHKFDGAFTAIEMQHIFEEERIVGADVCKIVGTAEQIQDNLVALNFVSENAAKTQLVCFCMGEQGKISRLLSPVFGAFFTFASLEQGKETAPGQININDMRTAYSLLRH